MQNSKLKIENHRARRRFSVLALLILHFAFLILNCSCSRRPDPHTLVLLIEASPLSLDPRVGADAQSQRIYKLLFDTLVRRDEHFNLAPALAERWEIPDRQTYIFHLRHGVRFHDGRPLTARDVKWTFDTVLSGAVRSAKRSTYQFVRAVEAPDDFTI